MIPIRVRVAMLFGCGVDDHDAHYGPTHWYCRDGEHDDGDTRHFAHPIVLLWRELRKVCK